MKYNLIYSLLFLVIIGCERESMQIIPTLSFSTLGDISPENIFIQPYSNDNIEGYISAITYPFYNEKLPFDVIIFDKKGSIIKKYQIDTPSVKNIQFIKNNIFVLADDKILQYQLNNNEITNIPFISKIKLDSLNNINIGYVNELEWLVDKDKFIIVLSYKDINSNTDKIVIYSIDSESKNLNDISSIHIVDMNTIIPNIGTYGITNLVQGNNAFYLHVNDYANSKNFIVKIKLDDNIEGQKYTIDNSVIEAFSIDFSEIRTDNINLDYSFSNKNFHQFIEVNDNYIAGIVEGYDETIDSSYYYLATIDLSVGNTIIGDDLNLKKVCSATPNGVSPLEYTFFSSSNTHPFLKRIDNDFFLLGVRSNDFAIIIDKIQIDGGNIGKSEWGTIYDDNVYNNVSAISGTSSFYSDNNIHGAVRRLNNDGYNFFGIHDFRDHTRAFLMQLDNDGNYIE
jgi:hypothetical protein